MTGGVHIVGPAGYHDSLLRTWKSHGLICLLHVNPEPFDGAILRGIVGNDATLIGRLTNRDSLNDSAIQQRYEANPQAEAQNLWNIYAPRIATNPHYTAWQVQNEPVFGNGETRAFRIQKLVEFMRAVIDIFNAGGQGVALFNFARGTPEPDEWQAFYAVWRYALSKNASLPPGKKNVLSLHQYGAFNARGAGSLFVDEMFHLKRFELLIRPTLPPDLRRAEYIMTESGPDGGQPNIKGWKEVYGQDDAGRNALVADVRTYHAFLGQQAGCLGACFFTLRQEGGFDTFDIMNDPVAGMLATIPYPPLKPREAAPMNQPLPSWVTITRATVPAGQTYWRLKSSYWQDSNASGGTHHIYILQPHDATVKMLVKWGTESALVALDKPANEPAGNFAMYGATYSAQLQGRGVTLSDKVDGMKLPQNQHVSYFLEYELVVKEGEPMPEPTPEWQTALMDNLDAYQLASGLRLNPTAAIQRVVFSQGFVPVVMEKSFTHPQKSYPAVQKGERLSDGAKRYYTWSASEGVKWFERVPTPPETPAQTLNINTSRQSPNWNERPNNYRPMVLQLHHTGGGLASSLNHLCNPASKVSSHYVIGKEGEIYRLVDESKRAWHSGEGVHKGREDPNDFTISLEIVNAGDGVDPYPRKQIDAVIALSRDIVVRHMIRRDDVTTHKATRAAWKAKYPNTPKVSYKSDPSANFPLDEVINGIFAQEQQAA